MPIKVSTEEKDALKKKIFPKIAQAETFDALQDVIRELLQPAVLADTSESVTILQALATRRHGTRDTFQQRTDGNESLTKSVQEIILAIKNKYDKNFATQHTLSNRFSPSAQDLRPTYPIELDVLELNALISKLYSIPLLHWIHDNFPKFWDELTKKEHRETMQSLLPLSMRKDATIEALTLLHENILKNTSLTLVNIKNTKKPYTTLKNYLSTIATSMSSALALLAIQDSAIHGSASATSIFNHKFRKSMKSILQLNGSGKIQDIDAEFSKKSHLMVEKYFNLINTLFSQLSGLVIEWPALETLKLSIEEILTLIIKSKSTAEKSTEQELNPQESKAFTVLQTAVNHLNQMTGRHLQALAEQQGEIEKLTLQ